MLIYSIIIFIFSNALNNRRDNSINYSRVTLICLFYSCLLIYLNLSISFFKEGISLFNGLLFCEYYILFISFFIFIITIFIISIISFFPRKIISTDYNSWYKLIYNKTKILNKMGEQYLILEYPLIIMFILSGAIFLISSSDIISIFLSIELQSYGLYLISSIYRNSEQSISAGLTYFLLGGLSSCIILLGQSILYANSGVTNLEGIYLIKSISDSYLLEGNGDINIPDIFKYYIQFSLIIISVGLLFKISAAPFHSWSPDVYDAIPTITTTFVAIVTKISILIFLFELIFFSENSLSSISWLNNLIISSILSLTIGSLLGLIQYRIKRLYAYSTISHLGFILLALSINNVISIQAFFFYLIQYTISNLNAFLILITIGYFLYSYVYIKIDNLKEKNNSPIQLIYQLKGFFYLNPLLSISLAVTLFSFIGIPPLIGFFAKQMVLSAAIDNGYIFVTILAIITSIISAVYYLIIIKYVFFNKEDYIHNKLLNYNFNNKQKKLDYNIYISSLLSGLISVFTLLIMLFIFLDKEWINLINILCLYY